MTDVPLSLLQWLVNNCEKFPAVFWSWVGGSMLVSGLTAVYPDYTTRPVYARFIIGAFEPFVFNAGRLWRFVNGILPTRRA